MRHLIIFFVTLAFFQTEAHTQTAEQKLKAKDLLRSLTGIPPHQKRVNEVAKVLASQGEFQAAKFITSNYPEFLRVQAFEFSRDMWNKAGTAEDKLYDASATIIGMIRDEDNFATFLFDDKLYAASGCLIDETAKAPCPKDFGDERFYTEDPIVQGYPGYDEKTKSIKINVLRNNGKWRFVEQNGRKIIFTALNDAIRDPRPWTMIHDQGFDYRDKNFKPFSQKGVIIENGSDRAVAGVFSTWAFGKGFYTAGTNRAAVAYSMRNFLCRDIETLADASIDTDRIRQDVDRSPAGQPQTFLNTCSGCHAGMDSLAGAFSYYDFSNNRIFYAAEEWKCDPEKEGGCCTEEQFRAGTCTNNLVQNPWGVSPKMIHNSTIFPGGRVTTNDSWVNKWVDGSNASIGWSSQTSGYGASSYGHMLSQTTEFKYCMAKRAYKVVCDKSSDALRETNIKILGEQFGKDNFNLKNLFIRAAMTCTGEGA